MATGQPALPLLSLHDVDRIVVRCDVPLPLQVDGEDLGDVDGGSARGRARRGDRARALTVPQWNSPALDYQDAGMPTRTAAGTRTLTTTEAAVLALLAIEGERSGYDLLKLVSKAIAHVWAPARSQLYAVLPRLERDGLATRREVAQVGRPDKQLYRSPPKAGRCSTPGWPRSSRATARGSS